MSETGSIFFEYYNRPKKDGLTGWIERRLTSVIHSYQDLSKWWNDASEWLMEQGRMRREGICSYHDSEKLLTQIRSEIRNGTRQATYPSTPKDDSSEQMVYGYPALSDLALRNGIRQEVKGYYNGKLDPYDSYYLKTPLTSPFVFALQRLLTYTVVPIITIAGAVMDAFRASPRSSSYSVFTGRWYQNHA
jgi:hypothetical protein